MVVGPVGSGKSSLLRTLLNEMHVVSGSASLNGTVAYCPQESFLLNNLLMTNITFGRDFDQSKYDKVISVCELKADIDSFKAKDYTEIGENGINLSGGQKQRVSIARALYLGADIYLIDDSLSALDAHVARKIFENVIIGELIAKGRTVMMATHVLSFLEHADRVVFLKNGTIHCQGKFADLVGTHTQFDRFVSTSGHTQNATDKSLQRHVLRKPEHKFNYNPKVFDEFYFAQEDSSFLEQFSINPEGSSKMIHSRSSLLSAPDDTSQTRPQAKINAGRLIKKERKETGQVDGSVFWEYFSSGGACVFVIIMGLFALVIVSTIFSEYWISVWTSDGFGLSESTYLKIYGGILGLMVLLNILRGSLFGWYVVRIGVALFKNLVQRIIQKPMQFFDTTPIGQLLNLTGKDSDFVDVYLGKYSTFTFDGVMRLIGIFIISGAANYFLIPVVACKSSLPVDCFNGIGLIPVENYKLQIN